MTRIYDVIVVGAGPSGSTAARLCIQRGFSTLLLEKQRFPRFKPCAGAISTRTQNQLDFKINNDLVQEAYREAKIYRPKGDYFRLESKTPFSIAVSRKEFDNFLVEMALSEGVNFIEGEVVRSMTTTADKITIRTNSGLEVSGNVVVGADGAGSIVAREAGLRHIWKPFEVALCFVSETNLGKEAVRELSPEPSLELYFGVVHTGYGWVFPKGDSLSIGVGRLLSEIENSRELFPHFVSKITKLTALKTKPIPHLVPLGGIDRNIYTDRTILVGDAAGFVDPLIGEGIFYAILSGKFAAKTIEEAFNKQDFSKRTMSHYKEICQMNFLDDLRFAHSFAKKVYSHPNLMLGLFIADNELRKLFTEILEGKKTYREFTRKLYSRFPIIFLKSLKDFH